MHKIKALILSIIFILTILIIDFISAKTGIAGIPEISLIIADSAFFIFIFYKFMTGKQVVNELNDNKKNSIEEELYLLKFKVKSIIDAMSDGFLLLDKKENLISINKRFEKIWGINKDNFLGKNITRLLKEIDLQELSARIIYAKEKNDLKEFEFFDKKTNNFFLINIHTIQEGISLYFTEITRQKFLQAKLEEYANTDMLTGVLNRNAGLFVLDKKIHESIREKTALMICYIDINNLKEVNDVFGHTEGDWLMKNVVDMIKTSIRESDILCRLSGDEFLIILPKCDSENLNIIKERIDNNKQKINDSNIKPYPISFKYGFVQYPLNKRLGLDEFITYADKEMNKQKKVKK